MDRSDLSRYLLRTDRQFRLFRSAVGEDYDQLLRSVDDYVHRIDANVWVEYSRGVPDAGVPRLVGALCCYVYSEYNARPFDWVEFSEGANRIRRNLYTPGKPLPVRGHKV